MKTDNIRIFEPESCDIQYVAPINSLLAQLSSAPPAFTEADFVAIVKAPCSHLFLLECDGAVVGMLTLGGYVSPTGRKYWIEDVVVDTAVRGRSLGRRLVEHAIHFAKGKGPSSLMLTSKPARVAANALYRSLGFLPKETNLYRMSLGDE